MRSGEGQQALQLVGVHVAVQPLGQILNRRGLHERVRNAGLEQHDKGPMFDQRECPLQSPQRRRRHDPLEADQPLSNGRTSVGKGCRRNERHADHLLAEGIDLEVLRPWVGSTLTSKPPVFPRRWVRGWEIE